MRTVKCLCNHLTSFGSDFFVPPNTIDFSSAYSNLGAKLKDNFGVLLTLCLMLGIYFALCIFARYKDKKDVAKVSFFIVVSVIYINSFETVFW